ncbi:unnamed protein product [Camellia sinensis]
MAGPTTTATRGEKLTLTQEGAVALQGVLGPYDEKVHNPHCMKMKKKMKKKKKKKRREKEDYIYIYVLQSMKRFGYDHDEYCHFLLL